LRRRAFQQYNPSTNIELGGGGGSIELEGEGGTIELEGEGGTIELKRAEISAHIFC
jgi:hypothetical protein